MLIYLAPMDWITDCPYRIITKEIFDKYNKINELGLVSEFMSADGFVHSPKWVCKHIIKTEIDKEVIAQIFWWNKDNLVNTAINLDQNYDFWWIELNIWCPSPKIMACGWWSWMIKEKNNTLAIIEELSKNVKNKFSIKTRIWLNDDDKDLQFKFVVNAAERCKQITIHGRYFKQWHSWDVDWDFIYKIKEKVGDKCKVIWNWWIKSFEDWLNKVGNLDGFMIWQAAIWNPWILTPHTPTIDELLSTILRHLDLSIGFEIYSKKVINDPQENNYMTFKIKMPTLKDIENEYNNYDNLPNEEKEGIRAWVEFRKHLFSYLKWLPDSKEFKQDLIHIREYKQLRNMIINFFEK